MKTGSHFLALLLAFVAIAATPARAQQDYPSRQIVIMLGLAAGGGADTLTRYFASKLQQVSGQSVVVENKPGALGNIAGEAAARARPDGYTLLIGPNTTFSANVHLFKKLPFDPVKDFAPVTTLLRLAFVLVVNPEKTPSVSATDLAHFLKAKGTATFGAPTGTSLAAGELYKSLAGFPATQVPYRTMQQALIELTSGEIDLLFADATFVLEPVRAGKYRALAVTTEKRSAAAPELPTMIEAGYPGFGEITAWFAMAAPAGTPGPVIDRLNTWMNQILLTEETQKFLVTIHAEAFPSTSREMAAFQAREIEKWGRLVSIARIEPQ
jgi:tripartite-type tricarboxylate transporter receptor subunit TctC